MLSMCGCTSGGQGSLTEATPIPTAPAASTSSKPIASYKEVREITWLRVADAPLDVRVLEFILLNFGLKINEKYFPSQNQTDAIMQLYMVTDIPDLVTGISVETAKTLAERGYLAEISEDDPALADYFKLWQSNAEGYAYTKEDIQLTDAEGNQNMYCIVPVNTVSSLAWVYNKTVFEKSSIDFPQTVNELYGELVRYKKVHESTTALWTNRNDALHFNALLSAYGLTDDTWQTNASGEVVYLYAQKEWYKALEWLVKFEKAGLVPTDKKGVLTSYTDAEYDALTEKSGQIIEFTESYNYMLIQNAQKRESEWAVAGSLIQGETGIVPVIAANCPYVNEATCFSAQLTAEELAQVMAFVNWCCTDAGNIWANFGNEGEDYRINENGEFEFLKYYSDEMTPGMSAKKDGKVSCIGRMYTVTPWEKINIPGKQNIYSAQNEFLANAEYRIVYPERFCSITDAVEDKTKLWEYTQISNKLKTLSSEFEEFSRENGFSEYHWEKYYNSLIEAGLLEYQELMQARKQ